MAKTRQCTEKVMHVSDFITICFFKILLQSLGER